MPGLGAIRAGATGVEVDRAARQVLSEAGYGDAFGHGLGHGVGIAVHEDPRLSPRGTNKLEAGMVVTVEPGLYLADWGGIRLGMEYGDRHRRRGGSYQPGYDQPRSVRALAQRRAQGLNWAGRVNGEDRLATWVVCNQNCTVTVGKLKKKSLF